MFKNKSQIIMCFIFLASLSASLVTNIAIPQLFPVSTVTNFNLQTNEVIDTFNPYYIDFYQINAVTNTTIPEYIRLPTTYSSFPSNNTNTYQVFRENRNHELELWKSAVFPVPENSYSQQILGLSCFVVNSSLKGFVVFSNGLPGWINSGEVLLYTYSDALGPQLIDSFRINGAIIDYHVINNNSNAIQLFLLSSTTHDSYGNGTNLFFSSTTYYNITAISNIFDKSIRTFRPLYYTNSTPMLAFNVLKYTTSSSSLIIGTPTNVSLLVSNNNSSISTKLLYLPVATFQDTSVSSIEKLTIQIINTTNTNDTQILMDITLPNSREFVVIFEKTNNNWYLSHSIEITPQQGSKNVKQYFEGVNSDTPDIFYLITDNENGLLTRTAFYYNKEQNNYILHSVKTFDLKTSIFSSVMSVLWTNNYVIVVLPNKLTNQLTITIDQLYSGNIDIQNMSIILENIVYLISTSILIFLFISKYLMKKRTYSKDAYMLFSQVGFKYLFYIACILVILEELLILFKITINIEYIFRFIFIFVSISIFTVTFLLSKTDKRLIWKLSAFEALYASFMLLFNFSGLNLYVNFDMFSDDPGQLFNLRLNITGSILDVLTQFIGLLIIIALLINTSIIFNSWEQLKKENFFTQIKSFLIILTMLQFFSIFTLMIILSFKYNIITFSPIFFYDLILILNGVDFICSLGIILLLVPLYKYFQPTNADAQDVTNLKNRSIILLTGFLILPIGIFFLLSQIFFTFSDYRTIINIMIILLSIFFVLALITSVLYKYFHKNFFSSYTNKRLLKIQTLFKIGLLEIPVAFLFLISYATYRNGDLASAINTFISFIGICFFLLIIISILQNISPNKKFYDITTNTYFAIQRNNNDLSKKMENYFIITVALVLFYQYFSTTSVLPYIGFPNNFFSAIPLYLLLYNKSIFVSLVLLIFGLGLFYYIYKSEDIKKNANFSISIKIIAIAFILLSINFINFYIAMNGIILLILGLMFCSSQKIEIIFDNYFFNNLPKFREILQQIAVAEDQHKKVELATSLYDQVRIQFVIETKTNFIPDKETIQKYIENCINNSSKFLVDK